ncbi:MAG: NAD-dependent epimerase/dehydratase family protein, partial [Deinococcales bacterium]
RRTLRAIAELERMITSAAPLEGLVLRYGNFYGPGAAAFLDAVRHRKLPIVGNGAGLWPFIHLADAADATVAALDHGTPGLYNIVDDDPAPASEWILHLAEAAGAKPPLHVPGWLGRLAAGEAMHLMMTQTKAVSNARAKSELGWAPRYPSWRQGFRSWADGDHPADRRLAA